MRTEKYYIKANVSDRRKLVNGRMVTDYRYYYTNNLMDIYKYLDDNFLCWMGFYIFKMPNQRKPIAYFSRSHSTVSSLLHEDYSQLPIP
jgi:hypothetical protein